jgi:hypothetical protein
VEEDNRDADKTGNAGRPSTNGGAEPRRSGNGTKTAQIPNTRLMDFAQARHSAPYIRRPVLKIA